MGNVIFNWSAPRSFPIGRSNSLVLDQQTGAAVCSRTHSAPACEPKDCPCCQSKKTPALVFAVFPALKPSSSPYSPRITFIPVKAFTKLASLTRNKPLLCERRCNNLPLGRSKSRPLGAAPWGVMPSKSKHVPRRVGRQVNKVMCSGLACLALL